jgi:hypothetical protein
MVIHDTAKSTRNTAGRRASASACVMSEGVARRWLT